MATTLGQTHIAIPLPGIVILMEIVILTGHPDGLAYALVFL